MQEYLKLTVQDNSDDSIDDSDNDTDFEIEIFVNTSIPVFLVGFNIGSREAAQLVALDIGSNLLWKYLGEVVVRENLAFERFIFGSSFDYQPAHEFNPLFGCTRKNNYIDKFNRVLGLGPSGISLASQLDSSEFSYCIGNLSDPFDEKNILIIGIKSGGVEDSTPLIFREFHYYVNLEGISFGGRMLGIDKKDLRMDNFKCGVGAIIDLGSSLSFL
ncbi:aspartic proteinase nepenthesin-2-like [Coffea eugenioides]|uniref:aspartic proteinase nepenthesin-2-like n=1 Tax=Coffea eugenioides TaxID=49369 RepID=UPI000F60DFE8|nr:aspartic proteinase nepenthesin-2-like [Coffea eugenioides]